MEPNHRFEILSQLVTGQKGSHSDFAEQLSAFRTDPTFPCRHPAYAYYFSKRMGQTPNYQHCPPSVPFYLLDQKRGVYHVSIAPERVRKIHIMFASPGDSVASRFGHLSLRLIVCPSDSASDLECNENLFEHVVLGYVARVNDLELNLMKGAFGGYDAHLTGFSFMEAYRANTLLSDRNLYSIPLKLTPSETEQIVRELSEIHWSFRGNYRFFTNNCATLLQETLAGLLNPGAADEALPRHLETGFLRPDSFFAALKKSNLADAQVLASLEEAEQRGHYFPSTRPYYQQAFGLVQGIARWKQPQNLDQYLRTPAELRLLKALKSDELLANYSEDPRVHQAHLLLEEKALIELEQARLQAFTGLLVKPQIMSRLRNRVKTLSDDQDRQWLRQCVLQPVQQLRGRLPVSEGIPDSEFTSFLPANGGNCNEQTSMAIAERLVNRWLPQEHPGIQHLKILSREIEQTHENLAYLRKMQ